MMIHQFDDVATTETMLQHITLQGDLRAELKFHSVLRFSGIWDKCNELSDARHCSVIQMVRTDSQYHRLGRSACLEFHSTG